MYLPMFVQLFVILLGYVCYRSFGRPNVRDPLAYPGALPIIGHAHLLVGDTTHLWRFVKRMQQHNSENGGVTYIVIGRKRYYAVSDSEDCTKVASVCFEKSFFYRNIVSTLVGEGLVTASGIAFGAARSDRDIKMESYLQAFKEVTNIHNRLLMF